MKNKGFTLIELLAVIVLLTIIGTIVTINFSESLDNANTEACNSFKKNLKEAAIVYFNLHKESEFTLESIIKEGLLDYEKNPCDENKDIDTTKIEVSINTNGVKEVKYGGEYL